MVLVYNIVIIFQYVITDIDLKTLSFLYVKSYFYQWMLLVWNKQDTHYANVQARLWHIVSNVSHLIPGRVKNEIQSFNKMRFHFKPMKTIHSKPILIILALRRVSLAFQIKNSFCSLIFIVFVRYLNPINYDEDVNIFVNILQTHRKKRCHIAANQRKAAHVMKSIKHACRA